MSSTSSSWPEPQPVPNRSEKIDVDAAMVARALDLAPEAFRKLMDHGHIRTLSERGVGADEGRFRLSFYYRTKRFRIITDASGRMIAREETKSR